MPKSSYDATVLCVNCKTTMYLECAVRALPEMPAFPDNTVMQPDADGGDTMVLKGHPENENPDLSFAATANASADFARERQEAAQQSANWERLVYFLRAFSRYVERLDDNRAHWSQTKEKQETTMQLKRRAKDAFKAIPPELYAKLEEPRNILPGKFFRFPDVEGCKSKGHTYKMLYGGSHDGRCYEKDNAIHFFEAGQKVIEV